MKTAHRTASRAKRRWAADPSTIYRLMGRAQGFTPEEQAQLNLPTRLAFEHIRVGSGTDEDFHTLAAAVNVAMVCAERIDALVEEACIQARDALTALHARRARSGRWGFDGPGMQHVLAAIDIYEQLTKLLNAGQLQDAMAECVRRMRTGNYVELDA